MKRNLLVLIIVTLLVLALMTACSPKAKTPTAAPTKATVPTAYPAKQEAPAQSAATAYPAKQEAPAQSAATAYPATAPTAAPATVSTKLTDAQVLALIEKQLNGQHTMDFLLSKKLTSDQWVQILNQEQHTNVIFTPGELAQVIAYLIAHQK